MTRQMSVVLNVPTISASAPKAGALPSPGFGIHRGLVKNSIQLSFGTIGAASLKMNRKMAPSPMMLLQPHSLMSHSVGFSVASKKLNFLRALVLTGSDMEQSALVEKRRPAW